PLALADLYANAYTPRRGVVLDPLAHPWSAADAAERADRRGTAKSREPLGEWARGVIAHAPAGEEVLAALDRVGESALVGTPHRVAMRELYGSTCATCRGPVVVEAFLWERDAPVPTKKAFRCGICAREGRALLIEAVNEEDERSGQRLEQRGMAYWQFVERFGGDPAAQALGESTASLYTPRNLVALMATLRAIETALPESAARDVLRLCLVEVLVSGSRMNALAGRGAPLRIEKGRARRSHAAQTREVNVWLEFDRAVRDLVSWLAVHPSPARGRATTRSRRRSPAPRVPRRRAISIATSRCSATSPARTRPRSRRRSARACATRSPCGVKRSARIGPASPPWRRSPRGSSWCRSRSRARGACPSSRPSSIISAPPSTTR